MCSFFQYIIQWPAKKVTPVKAGSHYLYYQLNTLKAEQVDILIFKNQAFQILYSKHHAYKTS